MQPQMEREKPLDPRAGRKDSWSPEARLRSKKKHRV